MDSRNRHIMPSALGNHSDSGDHKVTIIRNATVRTT